MSAVRIMPQGTLSMDNLSVHRHSWHISSLVSKFNIACPKKGRPPAAIQMRRVTPPIVVPHSILLQGRNSCDERVATKS